jgi:hypothetical protein
MEDEGLPFKNLRYSVKKFIKKIVCILIDILVFKSIMIKYQNIQYLCWIL